MKTAISLIITLAVGTASFGQTINFEDANLKSYLLTENCVDTNNDGVPDSDADVNNDTEIQLTEALNITSLFLGNFPDTYFVASVEDLHHFSNLEKLRILYFGNMENFELLGLTNLTDLYIGTCATLKRIDISDLPNLVNQSIEDITTLEYLNMQNNNFPSGTFSLFYTENIDFACIDDTPEEYAAIEYHMEAGTTPTTNCALGIATNTIDEIQLIPNPTRNFLILITKNRMPISLSIADVSGRIIKNYNTNFTHIDVSSLAEGMYYVNIQLSDNQSILKKIIKN
ncbi:hypothetical protein IMCC3317_25750 [Kordia antarctica]|uniref:Secretion system C-terminal sorting domain-containing protein n=1 Tax=Kordia antarctica TaxID=1218801 RepID=A0A7L4ZL55_9FLAO|nr:T9SS type A sorting domain-containing protein [Kordia antarctica]QHI37197.1 hypothetical protein IMCC3317_25750 [Kordia antarctica]